MGDIKVISRSRMLSFIQDSLNNGKPAHISYELCRHPFGFKRVDGIEFMLTKLLKPSVTEEQMSYLPKHEVIDNVRYWSETNGIACYYDVISDEFIFYKYIKIQY